MSTGTFLFIGMILILVLGLPAVMWLTKLIRPPKPGAEHIHRKVAETRQKMRQKIGRLPPV
jgi:di/tricarboxylate transporter